MRAALRWCFLALVLVLVLTGGTIARARHGQPPDYLAALHFKDCHIPCWMGIVPGKTTLEEARGIILSAFAGSTVYRATPYPTMPPLTLAIALQNPLDPPDVTGINVWIEIRLDGQSDDVVDTIRLTFSEHTTGVGSRLTLGSLYSLYGEPDSLALAELGGSRFDFPAMVYGDDTRGGAAIFPRAVFPFQYKIIQRYEWSQPIKMLEFFSAGNSPITPSWRIRKWLGFTALGRY